MDGYFCGWSNDQWLQIIEGMPALSHKAGSAHLISKELIPEKLYRCKLS